MPDRPLRPVVNPATGRVMRPVQPVLDPNILINPGNLNNTVDRQPLEPLLLLPLRLEYRVVTKRDAPVTLDRSVENAALARVLASDDRSLEARVSRATSESSIVGKVRTEPPKTAKAKVSSSKEIWFRWYPDENFSEKGIEPLDDREARLLADYLQKLGSRDWWRAEDPRVAELWQNFAGAVGLDRALHLLRQETMAIPNQQDRIGRIAALPRRVELFALVGDDIVSIGQGVDIPANSASERSAVSYTYKSIEAGGWLADFETAISNGMAMKLTKPAAVEQALEADWIIAVGLHPGGADKAEIESLFRDRIANGELEILAQDTPTNNSPTARTPLHSDQKNPLEYLTIGAQLESGAVDAAPERHAARLLAEALGLDPQVIRKVKRAASTDFADAQAMMRVIGPALFDAALNGITMVRGVSETEFIEVLAEAFAARGALPVLRSGDCAYGIATITDIDLLDPGEGRSAKGKLATGFLKSYAKLARDFLTELADEVTPVLRPDDPDASEKLEDILKTNGVSKRLDVSDVGSQSTRPIGCPYVAGPADQHNPISYLRDLRTKAIGKLVDPTEDQPEWPLLYRLARQTLTQNTIPLANLPETPNSLHEVEALSLRKRREFNSATSRIRGFTLTDFGMAGAAAEFDVSAGLRAQIEVASERFGAALKHLESVAAREDGTAQLATLMLEVFDFLQHRADAWATGLAYDRLLAQRRAGHDGLSAGYYGFIGKLREENTRGSTDGYVQAPSMTQASVAAIMRSAYLRHRRSGAFAINLRSRRVRGALALLDLLAKGVTLNEALGMRGERWLRDRKLSQLIALLRLRFPIVTRSPPSGEGDTASVGRRIIDGLALIGATILPVTLQHGSSVKELQRVLADDLDALADVVMAEAVYHRAIGATESANAWLQVLSGGHIPGDPQFLRIQRRGHGSSHRVAQVFRQPTKQPDARPRCVAEPAIAAHAATALAGFSSVKIKATLRRTDDPAKNFTFEFSFAQLDMVPIDLVLGGKSELVIRVRHLVMHLWQTDPAVAEALGPVEGQSVSQALASAEFTLLGGGRAGLLEDLVAKASLFRKVVQASRALEPSDLNTAASPSERLDEAGEIALVREATRVLSERAGALQLTLGQHISQLADARRLFVQSLDLLSQAIGDGQANAVIATRIGEAELQRRALVEQLKAIARWVEPTALRLFTVDEAFADIAGTDERIAALEKTLSAKMTGLAQALSTAAMQAESLSAIRGVRDGLVAAMQAALDGDGLLILPPYEITRATQMLVGAGGEVVDVLGDWANARSTVERAIDFAKLTPKLKAYSVLPEATDDDDGEDPDDRLETIAPRSRHYGTYLFTQRPDTPGDLLAGMVIDEWAEQRPSEQQMGGLAVNYDTPQAQSPHGLLLCVAPNDSFRQWTGTRAAAMVRETIAWTKIRALSATDKMAPGAMLPNGNQLAYQNNGRSRKPRVPKQKLKIKSGAWFDPDMEFAFSNDADTPASDVLNERPRPGGGSD